MSPSIETLITRAIDLGLQTAIASGQVAENRGGEGEITRDQQSFEKLSRAFKDCLQEIKETDPDHFLEHRSQVTAMVREAIKINPDR